jgi:hypothetical protein
MRSGGSGETAAFPRPFDFRVITFSSGAPIKMVPQRSPLDFSAFLSNSPGPELGTHANTSSVSLLQASANGCFTY